MPLTDTHLRNFKPQTRPYRRSDGGGLFIQVEPTGSKLWRIAYRYLGKQKMLSGGAYPAVGLAAARRWREKVKEQLAADLDPSVVRRQETAERRFADAATFQSVAERWFATQVHALDPKYRQRIANRLERDAYKVIGSVPIHQVDRAMVLDMLRKVERRGSLTIAERLKNHVSQIFRFAIAEGTALTDPTAGLGPALKKPPAVQHMAKLRADEVPEFFAKVGALRCEPITRLAIKFTILTMVRTSEARFATWSEFEGLGTAQPIWRIPAKRMKMRTEHIVPIAPQIAKVLANIREATVRFKSPYLFPVPTSKSKVISENRMLYAIYDAGFKGRTTMHGFRGLASTVLNEATIAVEGEHVPRWHSDWIELQLAHVERDAVRAAYNSAQHLGARTRMMAFWCDWVELQETAGELIG